MWKYGPFASLKFSNQRIKLPHQVIRRSHPAKGFHQRPVVLDLVVPASLEARPDRVAEAAVIHHECAGVVQLVRQGDAAEGIPLVGDPLDVG